MNPIFYLIHLVLEFYSWVVIAAVIMNLLVHFRLINMSNQFAAKVYEVLERLTEPALSRIRNHLPALGGIDISPIILLILIQAADYTIFWLSARFGI